MKTRAITALSLALVAAACGSSKSATTSASVTTVAGAAAPATKGGKIALLLPESKTTRYEAFDRPLFEAKVKALCATCELTYANADQDAAKQLSQAEAALAQGVKVMVIDAVDGAAMTAFVQKAKAKGVAVIAYDRLLSGTPIDAYVSFDNVKVGEAQGAALLEAVAAGGDPKRGKIVMINGAPTDPSAAEYKKGAHNSLDGKADIGREFDTPDWSPDKAQQQMEQAITALGKDSIIGVYAANDGTAGGAIAAMQRAGFTKFPPITGQDAELAAVQRILTGQQYMTIYLDIRAEAEASAELAVKALAGGPLTAPTKVNNGAADIPSVLLAPISVTRAKVKDTIIKDGFYKAAELCAGEAAAACTELGIK
jgi:D-xylose transport system substrate-binding protein